MQPPFSEGARYYEYMQSVDPVREGVQSAVPMAAFSAALYQQERTQMITLNLQQALGTPVPATSPALCAHFIRVLPGETQGVEACASSELFYVLRGSGTITCDQGSFIFASGDFFCMPTGRKTVRAHTDTVLYYINDAPLLAYLGCVPHDTRFAPTLYPGKVTEQHLQGIRDRSDSARANRISVILGHADCAPTRSVTPILWTMLGVLPRGAMQRPHRHQAVALDLIVSCEPGVYTLVGDALDMHGRVVDGARIDWQPGMAFITPPGRWHSHHNESRGDAHLVPVQDAGLHSHLRSLDIRFSPNPA